MMARPARQAPFRRLSTLLAALTFAASAPAMQPQAAAPSFDGPVLRTNFADPFVLPHRDRFLAYATNMYGDRANVPMAFSTDLVNWQLMAVPGNPDEFHDALPNLPAWAARGSTWAPEVLQLGERFILYFTAKHRRSDQQCVGAAVASNPRGPFVPQGSEPLICQHRLGGTIDASPFRDADGQLYLYFKNDGNHHSARTTTQLWGQRMSADGLSMLGEPVALERNDAEWEGHITEAPFMVRRGGRYILFFSANDYYWHRGERLSRYATGYATCQTPLGPCVDAAENPILASRREPDCLSGPGHPAVFEAGGRHYIAFHAWGTRGGCRRGEESRYMHILPLDWNGDAPVIGLSR
ncbi:MAG: glycoside hydrolase family 43 protein [Pseudomonadota bacterium]|nr:glycoside hydrolase family 43 protein [Pseudomonadota bacterium]